MADRPILFSAPMVCALLEGRKTQTRRLLTPLRTAPSLPDDASSWTLHLNAEGFACLSREDGHGVAGFPLPRCPYGAPGDRLWVREAWARRLDEDHLRADQLEGQWAWYWADPQTCNTGCAGAAGKRRPSIFMPRWASRVTLEVTGVRVERLQDITADDVTAEGLDEEDICCDGECGATPCSLAVPAFARLWDSINGKRAPWASNPWVWVVEFRPAPLAGASARPAARRRA